MRSFAYATGPAYGLLLDRAAPGWQRRLRQDSGFDDMLRSALALAMPADVAGAAASRAGRYDGRALRAAESARDRERRQRLAKARARFVAGPVLTLPFRHMSVQFDPRELQPLDAVGTVYPVIRVSDDWGVIEAHDGALMKTDWSALVVTAPRDRGGVPVRGDGWTLTLQPGWTLQPGQRDGDLVLVAPPP